MAVITRQERLISEEVLAKCMKDTDFVRQQLMRQITDIQVSYGWFQSCSKQNFYFHSTFFTEIELQVCPQVLLP
jgi:hypothetical protein